MGGTIRSLICYKDKIVVPKQLQRHVIDWYHTTLCHPGINSFHTSLKSTPGQLVFGRDMIFNIQHIANWEYIKQRKKKIINLNNQR
jgi:hypothetical protein